MTEAGIAKLEREGDNEDTETTKAANEEKEVCIYSTYVHTHTHTHTRTPQSIFICKR